MDLIREAAAALREAQAAHAKLLKASIEAIQQQGKVYEERMRAAEKDQATKATTAPRPTVH